ncbi:hypothetical protein B0H15DRAFT_1019798 [Mycena belliarum]|uniref:Uncharacterized protein n=1 Tax=Mycena belliarum TaxID=1033014 RepID=A0AAD6UE69_9AGAR|nr:hypothetical protein B0H15DRAFT_1019798 [Mycena belliae]
MRRPAPCPFSKGLCLCHLGIAWAKHVALQNFVPPICRPWGRARSYTKGLKTSRKVLVAVGQALCPPSREARRDRHRTQGRRPGTRPRRAAVARRRAGTSSAASTMFRSWEGGGRRAKRLQSTNSKLLQDN